MSIGADAGGVGWVGAWGGGEAEAVGGVARLNDAPSAPWVLDCLVLS